MTTRRLKIILPVRSRQKLGKARVLVGKVELFLQRDPIHLESNLFKELRRSRKPNKMNPRHRPRTDRAVGIKLEWMFDRVEILPKEYYRSFRQTISIHGSSFLSQIGRASCRERV